MFQTTNRERIQLLRDKAVQPVISYDHFRLRFWENYLENMMEHSPNPLVAKTLYEPFYKALKGERPNE